MKLVAALAICIASASSFAGAESLGARLDRLNSLKARAQQLQDEKQLKEAMQKAEDVQLPKVVAISGMRELSARLLLTGGVERNVRVGDHVGGGWSVFMIKPDEVLVERREAKDSKLVPLVFTSAPVDPGNATARARQAPINPPPHVPPLPVPEGVR